MGTTYLDDNGNPIAAPTAPAAPAPTYLDDNGNPIGQQSTSAGTIGAAPGVSAGKVLDTAARVVTDPIGLVSDALDGVTSKIENYTQEGRAEHPIFSRVGDLTRSAKELLTGGQSAGKPLGTSEGAVRSCVAWEGGAWMPAELAILPLSRFVQSISQIKAARSAARQTAVRHSKHNLQRSPGLAVNSYRPYAI